MPRFGSDARGMLRAVWLVCTYCGACDDITSAFLRVRTCVAYERGVGRFRERSDEIGVSG